MVYVVLYLVTALLCVNALNLAGLITAYSPVAGGAGVGLLMLGYSASSLADINLVIGIVMLVLGTLIITMDLYKGFGETVSGVVAATVYTFALAYVLLALSIYNLLNPGLAQAAAAAVPAGSEANPFVAFSVFKPMGWYCLPMSIMVFIFSLGFFNVLGKKLPKVPQFGVLFLSWAIAFFLFFYVLALGNFGGAMTFTGYYCLFITIVTIGYPAMAFFNGGKVGAW